MNKTNLLVFHQQQSEVFFLRLPPLRSVSFTSSSEWRWITKCHRVIKWWCTFQLVGQLVQVNESLSSRYKKNQYLLVKTLLFWDWDNLIWISEPFVGNPSSSSNIQIGREGRVNDPAPSPQPHWGRFKYERERDSNCQLLLGDGLGQGPPHTFWHAAATKPARSPQFWK